MDAELNPYSASPEKKGGAPGDSLGDFIAAVGEEKMIDNAGKGGAPIQSPYGKKIEECHYRRDGGKVGEGIS